MNELFKKRIILAILVCVIFISINLFVVIFSNYCAEKFTICSELKKARIKGYTHAIFSANSSFNKNEIDFCFNVPKKNCNVINNYTHCSYFCIKDLNYKEDNFFESGWHNASNVYVRSLDSLYNEYCDK